VISGARVCAMSTALAEPARLCLFVGHGGHGGLDAGIDRYLRAFETGAMPEAICGTRVKALGSQSTALRARREQLAGEMGDADLTAPSLEELSALHNRVAEALASGDPAPVKTLLQALIHEIRVDPAERPSTRSSVFLLVGATMEKMRFAYRPGRGSAGPAGCGREGCLHRVSSGARSTRSRCRSPARDQHATPGGTVFDIGDKVVYPHHGAAVVERRETKEAFGKKQEYLVLRLAYGDLTLMVPSDNTEGVGLREVINDEEVEEVFAVLRKKEARMPTNWSRRYKNHSEKLRSGDIYQVAEVVRNLSIRDKDKGLSAGEKRMLQRARQILVSELTFALNVDEETAELRLDEELP
jgi:CarD family transcriptional regulator